LKEFLEHHGEGRSKREHGRRGEANHVQVRTRGNGTIAGETPRRGGKKESSWSRKIDSHQGWNREN